MSESIKDNILFGQPFDQERYQKTLHDCGLEPDLKLFEDGEDTEIGEKGITLSGGQKARVTLARAVYSRSDVVLLDGESLPGMQYITANDKISFPLWTR